MKKCFTSILSVILILNAQSQIFQRLLGGNNADAFNAVSATPDGGCIMAGYADYLPEYPYKKAKSLITKLDSTGTIQWTKKYFNSRQQFITAVVASREGGYAAAGFIQNEAGDSVSMLLLKLTSDGKVSWIKYYKNKTYSTSANCLVQANDGSYYLGGTLGIAYFESAAYLIKTDAGGNLLWSKSFLFSLGNVWMRSMEISNDGSLIMAVSARYPDNFHVDNDMYVVKSDAAGNKIWSVYAGVIKRYKGATYLTEEIQFVHRTSDGGYVFGGSTASTATPGFAEPFIAKTDANGKKLWSKLIHNDSSYRILKTVSEAANGDLCFTGNSSNKKSNLYPYILKLRSDGSFVGSSLLTAATAPINIYDATPAVSEKIIAVGDYGSYPYKTAQAFFMKYDISTGGCGPMIEPDSVTYDTGYIKPIGISFNPEISIVKNGVDTGSLKPLSPTDICTTAALNILHAAIAQPPVPENMLIFPTLAISQIHIQIRCKSKGILYLKIYDLRGILIKTIALQPCITGFDTMVDISGLFKGPYFVTGDLDGHLLKGSFIRQ